MILRNNLERNYYPLLSKDRAPWIGGHVNIEKDKLEAKSHESSGER